MGEARGGEGASGAASPERASPAESAPSSRPSQPVGTSRALRIGAFGSEGSFTEEAAARYVEREGLEASLHPDPELASLFERLESGALDRLCLPLANSIGGLVRGTLEELGRRRFRPLAQVELPIRHALLVHRTLEDAGTLRAVASHPQAFLQCRRFLERRLPGVEHLERSDTASAARELAEGRLSAQTAVIASRRAARRFDLVALEHDVQDALDNRTQFLILEHGDEQS